jgi:hypothetical protein
MVPKAPNSPLIPPLTPKIPQKFNLSPLEIQVVFKTLPIQPIPLGPIVGPPFLTKSIPIWPISREYSDQRSQQLHVLKFYRTWIGGWPNRSLLQGGHMLRRKISQSRNSHHACMEAFEHRLFKGGGILRSLAI